MTAGEWRAALVETALHNEHPLVHESSVPMALIAELAHADGVKVLLSGEGRRRALRRLRVAAPRRGARLRRAGAVALLRDIYRGRQRPDQRPYEEAVRSRAWDAYGHHSGPRRRLEAALLADLRLYLPHLLNRQDKNTMQRSIETRVPFLDPSLVRFVVNLPLETRVEPERKGLRRELGSRVLPAEVASRRKVGFGFDVDAICHRRAQSSSATARCARPLGVPFGPTGARACLAARPAAAPRGERGDPRARPARRRFARDDRPRALDRLGRWPSRPGPPSSRPGRHADPSSRSTGFELSVHTQERQPDQTLECGEEEALGKGTLAPAECHTAGRALG